MTDQTIKPCPFCGAQASYSLEEDESQQNTYDTVSCSGCGAHVRALLHWAENGGEHAATLAAAWNTRTPDADPRDEVIKRMMEALEPLAVMAKRYDPDEGDDGHLECWSRLAVPKIHDLRVARAALTFAKEQLK